MDTFNVFVFFLHIYEYYSIANFEKQQQQII